MRTTCPRTRRLQEETAEFVARAFSRQYHYLRTAILRDTEDPRYDPEYYRIVLRRGRVASVVAIHERNVRVGAACMKMGGIGAVSTDPKFRRHGLAAVCFRDCIEVMERRGFELGMLFGIDRYYLRFGFAGCLPTFSMRLAAKDLEGVRNRCKAAPYHPRHLPAMLDMYNRQCLPSPCAAVRDRKVWAYALRRYQVLEGDPRQGRVFLRGRKLAGFLILRDGTPYSLGYDGPEGADAILACLRDAARERTDPNVTIGCIPFNHPMAAYARRFNHDQTYSLRLTGGGMGRIINLGRFLAAMRPEFERRMGAAGLEGEGDLHLNVRGEGGGKHSLPLARGHPTLGSSTRFTASLDTTVQGFLQLAIGALDLPDLPDTVWTGDAPFLRALFGLRHPFVYDIDRF